MCGSYIVLEVPILSLGFAHLDAKNVSIFFLGIDLLGLFICFSLFGETFRFSMSNTFPAFDVYAVPACLAGIDLFLLVRFKHHWLFLGSILFLSPLLPGGDI